MVQSSVLFGLQQVAFTRPLCVVSQAPPDGVTRAQGPSPTTTRASAPSLSTAAAPDPSGISGQHGKRRRLATPFGVVSRINLG